MKQQIGKLLVVILLVAIAPASLAALTATVDRNRVTELDLVTYTLRLENATTTETPNFSAVERDFDIVQQSGPNRSSRITIINGRQEAESYTEWVLTLRPRRQGALQIPAVRVGSEVAQPISISVTEASAAARRQMDQYVFFETELDKETSYVQEQVIYTVRLFYVDSISGDFPPPPELENAVVETIENEKRYESIVSNRRFFVLEKQYAIYPQRSGILDLSPETFTGTRGRGSFFSARERVSALSQGHRLRVEPRPPGFTGDEWLPAKSLELEESWSNNFPDFRVGEPVNRTLTIRATGLASSLLPPFEAAEVDGAKTYQDPPVTNNRATPDGVVASLTVTVGIVPTRDGNLEIPEIRIPWWNTETDEQEVALLPARTVTVAEGSAPSVRVPQSPDRSSSESSAGIGVPAATTSNLWLYVSMVLALAWIITLWQVIAMRQKLGQQAPVQDTPADAQVASEKEAWQALKSACDASDAELARRSLYLWARHRYPNIHSLGDLVRASAHPGLGNEIKAMEAAKFAPNASDVWDGKSLLAVAQELRDQRSGETRSKQLTSTLNPPA